MLGLFIVPNENVMHKKKGEGGIHLHSLGAVGPWRWLEMRSEWVKGRGIIRWEG